MYLEEMDAFLHLVEFSLIVKQILDSIILLFWTYITMSVTCVKIDKSA